jgi:HAD superfamily hydrolase (TIGR01549 family)
MGLDVSRIKALCFDVDGTLSDTDEQWVIRFEKLLSPLKFLFREKNVRPFARHIVMGLDTPTNFAYEVLDRLHLDDDIARIMSRRLAKQEADKKPKSFLIIERTLEMLEALHPHFPMTVVTARDAHGTEIFLEQFDLHKYFQFIISGQSCTYTKPFPDPVIKAAEQMQVAPEACLMIGDTTVDIRAGKAAGAQTVGVLCGFGTTGELRRAGADLIVNTTADLVPILLEGHKQA